MPADQKAEDQTPLAPDPLKVCTRAIPFLGRPAEAKCLLDGLCTYPIDLAALLKTRRQELLGAVRPLFLLVLDFPS